MNSKVLVFSDDEKFVELCNSFFTASDFFSCVDDFSFLEEILNSNEKQIVLADFYFSKNMQILSKLRIQNNNSVFILSSKIEEFEKLPNYVIQIPFGFSKILSKVSINQNSEEFKCEENHILSALCGSSTAMKKVRQQILEASSCNASVLFTGESGTGKSLAAVVLHSLSMRGKSAKKLVTENIAAISPSLIESELFGVAFGAYTDAGKGREGLICSADGGSLFLDEIGELDFSIQAKLLLAVQERKIRHVGSDTSKNVDVRFIFATNQNLEQKIFEKQFRADLYYRISEMKIHLPPLREHLEDIEEIAEQYFKSVNSSQKFSSQALSKLKDYDWPGNVRELMQCFASCQRRCKSQIIGPEFIDF
ncbi:sigma-54-dependent transcriptional regulator [Treponema pectinovorum]|uniref:sigma-54-dependent transcriptional regulator n=1 Tax=Treponema pectinovorum TaxID=164 RepID=UPI0011CAAB9D|nr:sigma 54-interacting transcriptional regulator [Treponema pectinovorum]